VAATDGQGIFLLYKDTACLCVVGLRLRGKKLPEPDARIAVPRPDYLTLNPSHRSHTNERCLSAWLNEEGDTMSKNVLPPMENAWVRKAGGFQFVVVGIERIDKGSKNCEWFPQAWWCRLHRRK